MPTALRRLALNAATTFSPAELYSDLLFHSEVINGPLAPLERHKPPQNCSSPSSVWKRSVMTCLVYEILIRIRETRTLLAAINKPASQESEFRLHMSHMFILAMSRKGSVKASADQYGSGSGSSRIQRLLFTQVVSTSARRNSSILVGWG